MESKVVAQTFTVEVDLKNAPEIELDGRGFTAKGAILVWRKGAHTPPTVTLYTDRGIALLAPHEWPDWVCELVSEQAPR